MLAPLTAACVAAAASAFGVAEPMLWTILRAEGGKVGACTPQTNGTQDCGPAQVNAETWVPHLSRVLGRPGADVLADLRDDGCFNIHAGAYVLRLKIGESGGDRWDGAGRYNSATPEYKRAYQLRLVRSYADLYLIGRGRGRQHPAAPALEPALHPASQPVVQEKRDGIPDADGLTSLVSAPTIPVTAPMTARTWEAPARASSQVLLSSRADTTLAARRTAAEAASKAGAVGPEAPVAAKAPLSGVEAASQPPAPHIPADPKPTLIALPMRPVAFDPGAVPMPSVPSGTRPAALEPIGADRVAGPIPVRPQLHAAR